jgi:hypothetical protein
MRIESRSLAAHQFIVEERFKRLQLLQDLIRAGCSRDERRRSASVSAANRSSISYRNTIMDFESGKRTPTRADVQAKQSALEKAGVEFIKENGGGPA